MDYACRIFLSYHKKNRPLADRLVAAIREDVESYWPDQKKQINLWFDESLEPGDRWREKIQDELELSDIVLFLVTPACLQATYMWDDEFAWALKRFLSGEGRVRLIPVLYADAPAPIRVNALTRDLMYLPDKPHDQYGEQWYHLVARGLRPIISAVLRQQPPPVSFLRPAIERARLCLQHALSIFHPISSSGHFGPILAVDLLAALKGSDAALGLESRGRLASLSIHQPKLRNARARLRTVLPGHASALRDALDALDEVVATSSEEDAYAPQQHRGRALTPTGIAQADCAAVKEKVGEARETLHFLSEIIPSATPFETSAQETVVHVGELRATLIEAVLDSSEIDVTALENEVKALGSTFEGYACALDELGEMASLKGLHMSARLTVTAEQASMSATRLVERAWAGESSRADRAEFDLVRIDLGFGLLGFIDTHSGRKLTDQVAAVRRQLERDYGFLIPPVRIRDNLELSSEAYQILLKEAVAGKGTLRPRSHLAMNSSGTAPDIAGEKIAEPVFGLPAAWIDDNEREAAVVQGYTVVDPPTVLTTHFTEIVKDNMAELLTFAATKALIDDLPKAQRSLVDEIVPEQISFSGIQRVLQNLLREKVSIRDLGTILEAIAESSTGPSDLLSVTEHVRVRLARQICNANLDANGVLPVLALSPKWEEAFSTALVGAGAERQLMLEPSHLHQFVNELRQAFEKASTAGDIPILLTSAPVRPYIRSLIERFRPQTTVLSQNEIHPKARLRSLGAV